MSLKRGWFGKSGKDIERSLEEYTTRQKLLGDGGVLASVFLFYGATVFVRLGRLEFGLKAPVFITSRLFVGFILWVVVYALYNKGQLPHLGEGRWLLFGRAITNFLAVVLFFYGVSLTEVSRANMLNLTYPLFIAVIGYFLYRKESFLRTFYPTLIGFAGVYSITGGIQAFRFEDLFSLGSGLVAAVSIILLNQTRQHNDSHVVLLYVFGLGIIFSLLAFPTQDAYFWNYRGEALRYILASALLGICGQWALTYGLKYTSAIEGSLISSLRIFVAGLFSPLFFADETITPALLLGGLLLFVANWIVIKRRYGVSIS